MVTACHMVQLGLALASDRHWFLGAAASALCLISGAPDCALVQRLHLQ